MKLSILMFLFIGVTFIFFGCSEKNPSAPELSQSDQVTNTLAKKLIGDVWTDFFVEDAPFFWVGEVEFDDVVYGITFETLSELRNFSSASPVIESFVVYEWGDPETVYMRGLNHGVANLAQKPDPTPFVANGKITEANAPFEDLLGRNIHEQGLIYWEQPDGNLPDEALFTLRIN
jgi:hypothetical protein